MKTCGQWTPAVKVSGLRTCDVHAWTVFGDPPPPPMKILDSPLAQVTYTTTATWCRTITFNVL